jgi:hypothetical protein
MDTVWIRTHNDALIRAESIMTLENKHDGLYAECITGSSVQLTNGCCPIASQLALLEEIRQAGADDSRAVVITPVQEHDSLIWYREFADTLADRLKQHNDSQSRVTPKYPGASTRDHPDLQPRPL